jgi:glycosyltransferase involved in cell wall biosynthesis
MPAALATLDVLPARPLIPLPPGPSARVAVGVPVRNGGSLLEGALLTLTRQTHANLEILLSDNASTDGTAEICERFARNDSRIRYVRHEETLSAAQNFRYVVEHCESSWFMWASHDDLRDDNYVETLLSAFAANPTAALAVTDSMPFRDHRNPTGDRQPARSTTGLPFPARHLLVMQNSALQIYGLFRTEVLRSYRWPKTPVGMDWTILHWAAALGDVEYAPGSTFRYFIRKAPRTPAEMRSYEGTTPAAWLDFVKIPPDLRWALRTSGEIAYARRARGLGTNRLALFHMLCFINHGGPRGWAKSFIYRNAPRNLRVAWDSLKHGSAV